MISPALLSHVTFKKVIKPEFPPKIDIIWVSLFFSYGVIRDLCGSADTKKKYVIRFWGQPSLGGKEQSGSETPYKIISQVQFTESSLELKDTTTIFFSWWRDLYLPDLDYQTIKNGYASSAKENHKFGRLRRSLTAFYCNSSNYLICLQ